MTSSKLEKLFKRKILTIIATKYYLTPLLIECISACIILFLTHFFSSLFFRKRESPHLHILMNILRDMKDMIHWKHFQINFNDWSFIEHITVTQTMIMGIMTIGLVLHIQPFPCQKCQMTNAKIWLMFKQYSLSTMIIAKKIENQVPNSEFNFYA